MPYTTKGKCVYKKDTNEKVGCTKGSVKKYLAALHANVNESDGLDWIRDTKHGLVVGDLLCNKNGVPFMISKVTRTEVYMHPTESKTKYNKPISRSIKYIINRLSSGTMTLCNPKNYHNLTQHLQESDDYYQQPWRTSKIEVEPSNKTVNNICKSEKFCKEQGKITFGQLKAIVENATKRKLSINIGEGGYKATIRLLPWFLPQLAIGGFIASATRALNKILKPTLTETESYKTWWGKVVLRIFSLTEGEINTEDPLSKVFFISDGLMTMMGEKYKVNFAKYLSELASTKPDSEEVPEYFVENELRKWVNEKFLLDPPLNPKTPITESDEFDWVKDVEAKLVKGMFLCNRHGNNWEIAGIDERDLGRKIIRFYNDPFNKKVITRRYEEIIEDLEDDRLTICNPRKSVTESDNFDWAKDTKPSRKDKLDFSKERYKTTKNYDGVNIGDKFRPPGSHNIWTVVDKVLSKTRWVSDFYFSTNPEGDTVEIETYWVYIENENGQTTKKVWDKVKNGKGKNFPGNYKPWQKVIESVNESNEFDWADEVPSDYYPPDLRSGLKFLEKWVGQAYQTDDEIGLSVQDVKENPSKDNIQDLINVLKHWTPYSEGDEVYWAVEDLISSINPHRFKDVSDRSLGEAKKSIKEAAGISFETRKWGEIIYNEIMDNPNEKKRLIIDGYDHPEAFDGFPIDYVIIDFYDRLTGYGQEHSGYDKDGNYVVLLYIQPKLVQGQGGYDLRSVLNHEMKHAWDDYNRLSKGLPSIDNTKESKELYNIDFIQLLSNKQITGPIKELLKYHYYLSKIETTAYLENVYDGNPNYESTIRGIISKDFESLKDRFDLDVSWHLVNTAYNIPLLKKFKSPTDFIDYSSKTLTQKAQKMLKKINKMRYVHNL